MKNSKKFQKEIWDYYYAYGRVLPWRNCNDPYAVLVSEIMLQQTQVSRVLIKYNEFLKRFPSFESLACAGLSDVLLVWQGMGYNRRAKYLKLIATEVVKNHNGVLPNDQSALKNLPGIGSGTAGSLCAFIYNSPVVFIETNIRRVMLYYFFKNKNGVSDKEIFPYIEKTLDKNNPREWYYALMDYGAMLSRKEKENPNKRSAHYTKQTPFAHSTRKVRGEIIAYLLKHKNQSLGDITKNIKRDKLLVSELLKKLESEGMLIKKRNLYNIHNL